VFNIPFSTKRQKIRGGELSIPSEGRPAIYNSGRLFVQQPQKRKRDREDHLNYYASTYNWKRQLSHRKTKPNTTKHLNRS